ncbi:CPBP family glutamic-type intramembrane protease [Ancylothrix sp. C2]|uniref:CPBP family glutamic-type intramembrane protease n=1 Tax=Ancylothrix sp. D3o TaxID=2953691 RepID=UPI0021BABAEA|nr:CPBP family glutamic-type intramembrane protease [Ancylothrix sp. D3o]MCT7950413.1 CPBP family glutamic-type intramembrane protease [Ancylothrix sp. D3o]
MMLGYFVKVIFSRLTGAFYTVPRMDDWLVCAAILGVYTLIAVPVGWRWGFLNFKVEKSLIVVLGVILGSLLQPAFSEELFFRVLFLPHKTENFSGVSLWGWMVLGLICFIVYHPLNAISFFPMGKEVFFEPVFLFLAAVLGVGCTVVYWCSGSVWPAVVLHWVVVVVWLLLFGGYERLYAGRSEGCDQKSPSK